MPGIVGFVTRNPDSGQGKAQLAEMLDCMLHESFYVHGTYISPEHGCYLGWVSHPDAFVNLNPIVNRAGDKILIFSGEHLDHDSFDSSGHNGQKPGTHLINLYETKGEKFLLDLNGWFAGVLVDLSQQTILLFNDRFGIHRVYYHEDDGSFAFASEAKAILSVRPETRRLDTRGLGEFLGLGTTLQNRTLFSKIFLLPGGSAWTFARATEPSKRRYFNPATWEQQPAISAENFYDRLRSTMGRLLPAYFYPANDVGVSLTGGLDTRMMMAGRPPSDDVAACYTYGGAYRPCFDVQIAAEIAATCGQRHHVIPMGADFFRNFATLANETVWLTDGCLNICGTHEVYFSRLARQLAPIRVTGNYGSEILRSVCTFKYIRPSERLFDDEIILSLDQAKDSFSQISAVHPVSFAAFEQIPWQLYGRLAAAQSQLTVRSPYTDNDLVSLMYQAPPELRRGKEISLRLISEMSPILARIRTDLGYGGNGTRLMSLLRQAHRYVLFKAEWYYNFGMPDWLTRFDHNALTRRLETLFIGTHKIDHYRLWFRDQLFRYIDEVLSDGPASTRPYLNRHYYEGLTKAHRERTGNHVNEISKLVTLELIQRSLLSGDYVRRTRVAVGS